MKELTLEEKIKVVEDLSLKDFELAKEQRCDPKYNEFIELEYRKLNFDAKIKLADSQIKDLKIRKKWKYIRDRLRSHTIQIENVSICNTCDTDDWENLKESLEMLEFSRKNFEEEYDIQKNYRHLSLEEKIKNLQEGVSLT